MTANTWEYTFHNLPVYRDGEQGTEIVYTISAEEAVEGSLYGTYISDANGEEEEIVRYTASYQTAAGETTDDLQQSAYPYVKLTHGTDQGTVNIYASWHDDQNRDRKSICISRSAVRRPLSRPILSQPAGITRGRTALPACR